MVFSKNTEVMREEIREKSLLPTITSRNRGLQNVFSGIIATPQQNHDLLNSRKIGNEQYSNYIKYNILHQPSTSSAPVRKHRLLTMAQPIKSKKKVSTKEREMKNVEKCLRRRLAWCNKSGNSYEPGLEQYSIYPRALADCEGRPHKGSKATWTEKLRSRYPTASTLSSVPEAVVVDVAVLLYATPLKGQTITMYAQMLMRRHFQPHYENGAREVHLIFDQKSKEGGFNPKQSEQERRDKRSNPNHKHAELQQYSLTPHPWQEYINCRTCKYVITEAVGLAYLQIGRTFLKSEQKLIVGGCFGNCPAPDSAWVVSSDSLVPEPQPLYSSSATEADSRIWRHVAGTLMTKVLVYSPDTDVLNIGISFGHLLRDKDVTIQHNMPHKTEKFVSLNLLIQCLDNDPDLATIPSDLRGSIFQKIFIASGCDYTSYFSGFGKVAFLNIFYQHSNFICGTEYDGCLTQTQGNNKKMGFLAFLRLIGTLYFKKYLSAFSTNHSCETPQQLFQLTSTLLTCEERHEVWMTTIREVVSERILSEDERVPSTSALKRHWARTCWVSEYWKNSVNQDVQQNLPLPQHCGWEFGSDGQLIGIAGNYRRR